MATSAFSRRLELFGESATRVRIGPWWLRWLVRAVGVGAMGAGAYALWIQRHQVADGVALLGRINWEWLGVAIAAELASMVVFARLQGWLLKAGGVKVWLGSLVKITMAGNAMAVSLPAGAAWSAGFAFEQLRRRGASRALSLWVVVIAGALSSFALFLLLVLGVELSGESGPGRDFRGVGAALAALPAIALVAWLATARVPPARKALFSAAHRLASAVESRLPGGEKLRRVLQRAKEKATLVRPSFWEWLVGLALALANWLYDGICLVAVMEALGSRIPWPGVIVAYCLAQLGTSVPLTPGGIGIVEGTMSYVLVLYGLPIRDAVASVLLYRIVSFWCLVPLGWGAWGLLGISARRSSSRAEHWAWRHS